MGGGEEEGSGWREEVVVDIGKDRQSQLWSQGRSEFKAHRLFTFSGRYDLACLPTQHRCISS